MRKLGWSALLGMGLLALGVAAGRTHLLSRLSDAIWWPGTSVAGAIFPQGTYGESAAYYVTCAALVSILFYTLVFFLLLQLRARLKFRVR